MNAFLSKDPCHTSEQDYQPLMMLASQTVPCNKVTGPGMRSQDQVLTRMREEENLDVRTLVRLAWVGFVGDPGDPLEDRDVIRVRMSGRGGQRTMQTWEEERDLAKHQANET